MSLRIDDPRNVCRPIGKEVGASECFNLPVGAPAPGTLRSLTVEWRQWAPGESFGINPRYTYLRKKADGAASAQVVHTFEVPIYFMRESKDLEVENVTFGSGLIGGINVGWKNTGAQEGAFVVLFLTKAFGVP